MIPNPRAKTRANPILDVQSSFCIESDIQFRSVSRRKLYGKMYGKETQEVWAKRPIQSNASSVGLVAVLWSSCVRPVSVLWLWLWLQSSRVLLW